MQIDVSFWGRSLYGRSDVIFGCFQRHLRPVPMMVYPPKVSSERPQDAIGTCGRNVRNDPKVTVGKSGTQKTVTVTTVTM